MDAENLQLSQFSYTFYERIHESGTRQHRMMMLRSFVDTVWKRKTHPLNLLQMNTRGIRRKVSLFWGEWEDKEAFPAQGKSVIITHYSRKSSNLRTAKRLQGFSYSSKERKNVIMKKQLIRWILPLIAILVITTVVVLNVSLSMTHAASTTRSHHTQVVSLARPGGIVPDSFWHG